MKTLNEFISFLPTDLAESIRKTNGIHLSKPIHLTTDSRAVTESSIFFAIPGITQDGHQFIPEIESKNPTLIVHSKKISKNENLSYLQVPDTRLAYALFCSAFFENPSQKLITIGITGTSGKTTTSTMVQHLLNSANIPCGLIGTVAIQYGEVLIPTTHTTPDSFDLQHHLSKMIQHKMKAVVLEVSSHALEQNRVAGVFFDVTAFLNLSEEHLDYHLSMESYFHAKKRLFTEFSEASKQHGKLVRHIIHHDPWGDRLISELTPQTLTDNTVISSGSGLNSDINGIYGDYKNIALKSRMLGAFNAENWAIALDVALSLGVPEILLSKAVQSFSGVRGRLESVPNKRGLSILIDYAHKPDALKKVLQTLRGLQSTGRIITVFGCGGDRDRQKRPKMGAISEDLSDLIILTNDNPRSEDPLVILNEIKAGMSGQKPCEVIPDRRSAIQKALKWCQAGDIILIAGKGHETEQTVGKTKIHFDDREVTLQLLDE